MKNRMKQIIFIVTISLFMTACHDDLNQDPIDPDSFTEQDVFVDITEAKGALAKLYASLALTGQQGPAGQPDISGIDEGASQYTRMLFNLNELTTDHAVVGWGDPGLPDLHGLYWSAGNDFTGAMYLRLAQEVSFTNAFIQNASALSDDEAQSYIAEARFLRAFAYYNLIDFYANVPLVTQITTDLPSQSSRTDLFNYVESELLEIQDLLSESNEYGRVDKVAAWALLSKLYLNAEVWTGTARYTDCVIYSENVMNSSYVINTTDANGNGSAYDELFLADNNSNGAQNEFIFALNFDGIQSQTYGGSTFIVHAATGGSMDPLSLGVNGGWGGYRTTKALVEKFDYNLVVQELSDINNALGAITDWGIVGDGTPNGWDGPDTEMFEIATNKFALYTELTDGFLKFRFNEDWGNNYGDTGADGILEAAGDNIPVTAGEYYITFDLDNLTYTIETVDFNTLLESYIEGDHRAMFYTDGQSLEIESIPPFDQGYAVTKFKNIDSNGNQGNDSSGEFVDTDIPIIRLAEIYLNYAEANLRGGGGDNNRAVSAINELRARAYGDASGNISSSDLDLGFVLDERSRELYWEGQRRTDLIRFNSFTTNAYLWPFKGNQANGASVSSFRNIFPIPSNTISTNPNLIQNDGY
ncbi:SusD, outer membrane protein [Winogradskyella psychrotolerans RS-3]|uniref:SusD, outer membrane protein n=1 Tax=Winogradskyella psychrotolerans RS-3 TaxID=641526 RepID=S7VWP8_9FLAO|nr:RagB/SusD family nutrient uptake outer membrane protein [Winogradskyella psychrotolerans]EPR73807.1 SusD, outer membrane protein [Winogradskyella psychrotolerans RS-3]